MQTFLILFLLAAVEPRTATVTTVDGAARSGTIVALDSAGATLGSDGEQTRLPADQLLEITFPATPASDKSALQVRLADGSQLSAADFEFKGEKATCSMPHGEAITVAINTIRAIQFAELDAATAARWQQQLAEARTADLIAVRGRDGKTVNFLDGVIEGVTPESVDFRLDGDVVPVKRERVVGLVFARAAEPTAAPMCVVAFADGTLLNANSFRLEAATLHVETVAGVQLPLEWSRAARLDFSAGKWQYLSDMTPKSVRWTPLFGGVVPESMTAFYQPRRNQGWLEPQLTLDGRSYRKGLAVASRTELVYDIPAGSKQFSATLGLAPGQDAAGHVAVTLWADRKAVWQGELAAGDKVQNIEASVTGARTLRVLVDFGRGGDAGDITNFCEARFAK